MFDEAGTLQGFKMMSYFKFRDDISGRSMRSVPFPLEDEDGKPQEPWSVDQYLAFEKRWESLDEKEVRYGAEQQELEKMAKCLKKQEVMRQVAKDNLGKPKRNKISKIIAVRKAKLVIR